MTLTQLRTPAIIVGALLILAGLVLGMSGSGNGAEQTSEESLERVNQIEAEHELVLVTEVLATPPAEKPPSEFDLLRESIDWSEAPSPRPDRVENEDFELFVNVSAEFLLYAFEKIGYTGEKIASGETTAIPPLIVVSIPKGWAEDETVQFKKSMFYRVILPLILYENDAVLAEREQLLQMQTVFKNGDPVTAQQQEWLRELAEKYLVVKKDDPTPVGMQQIEELLLRVDMVSPSLALGQAAYESGYATSRFAHQGNALFGQWDWSSDAIKPAEQRSGKGDYGIKAFEYPIDSVRAYIWNLNTHYRYEDFRTVRSKQRGDQKGRIVLDGAALAETLLAYSERGQDYINDLKGMMSYNRLALADGLRLVQGEPIYFD